MKSRTSLSLIEQIIMIGVFAVAAAISLRIFSYSAQASKAAEAKDFAVTQSKNAAEVIKACGGDYEEAAKILGGGCDSGCIYVYYNENYELTARDSAYTLYAENYTEQGDLLGCGSIKLMCGEKEIYCLPINWQEDAG